MKRNIDWQDLRLFLAVARASGLAGASAATGVSAATLGRRVAALEADLEVRLVEREARGYQLTTAGRELMFQLEDMDQTARAIDLWRQSGRTRRRIRISAGGWTMRLLLDHLEAFWSPDLGWMPEFLVDPRDRDVARRQIDIGIRNRRPQQEWLAGRKVGTVRFAAYQAASVPAGRDIGWVGLVEDEANFPAATWIRENHNEEVTVTLNKATYALTLVRKGLVRMVLPCFVGDAFDDLVRLSDPIESLTTERWLVMHQDERHQPDLRQAISSLANLLKKSPVLTSGF